MQENHQETLLSARKNDLSNDSHSKKVNRDKGLIMRNELNKNEKFDFALSSWWSFPTALIIPIDLCFLIKVEGGGRRLLGILDIPRSAASVKLPQEFKVGTFAVIMLEIEFAQKQSEPSTTGNDTRNLPCAETFTFFILN